MIIRLIGLQRKHFHKNISWKRHKIENTNFTFSLFLLLATRNKKMWKHGGIVVIIMKSPFFFSMDKVFPPIITPPWYRQLSSFASRSIGEGIVNTKHKSIHWNNLWLHQEETITRINKFGKIQTINWLWSLQKIMAS